MRSMTAGGTITTPTRRPSRLRRVLGVLTVTGLVAALAGIGAMVWSAGRVAAAADGRVHTVDDVPAVPIAMVLGARAHEGRPSAFLAARLDLALDLWERGRIRAVLVSGANSAAANHQTTVMRNYLEQRGIPSDRIVEDPAGWDTYDSCVRARDVFGVEEMVILSQGYHVPRALMICEAVGIRALGVGDEASKERFPWGYGRGEMRERAANLKMEWDLATARVPQQDPYDPSLRVAAGLEPR